jgi:hypothetical protein
MDPNSAHQLWSRWTVTIDTPRAMSKHELSLNAQRYFRLLFRSTVGRMKVDRRYTFANRFIGWRITVEIEGPPAQDPAYRQAAKADILRRFVEAGFHTRQARIAVAILAGDAQDGRPPSQLIVLPTIAVNPVSDP